MTTGPAAVKNIRMDSNTERIKESWAHALALASIIIWGTTFVSTKILLVNGLTPEAVLFFRFLMAYLAIWAIGSRTLFAKNWKDEMLFLAAGVFGGSLYFVSENTALGITLASNVALIVSTAPILTAVLARLFLKGVRLRRNLIGGSLVALAGVALVVFNGRFVLKIQPLGDFLSFLSALSWAVYSLVLKRLSATYGTLFITRKVFFYGLLTLLPVFYFRPLPLEAAVLFRPVVVLNLLFLGLLASLLCYIMWNTAVKRLGAVRTTSYIYVVPLVTSVTSAAVIDERITWLASAGALLILSGVYLAEKGWRFPGIAVAIRKKRAA